MELIIWPDLVGAWPESWPERETPEQKLERDPVPSSDLGVQRESRGQAGWRLPEK